MDVDHFLAYAIDNGITLGGGPGFDFSFNLPIGLHSVTLSQVAPNCTDALGLTRSFTISAGLTTVVQYDLVCAATTGTIEVATVTTGANPDPDGYSLSLDGDPTVYHLATNGSAAFTGLAPGPHTVEITDGLEPNCTLAGTALRQVAVTAGITTIETFDIDCPATSNIEIVALTQGLTLDPNGYQISLDGGPTRDVLGNGYTIFGQIVLGTYSLSVSGVAPNCSLAEPNPRNVTVAEIAGQPVTITVTCSYQPGPRSGSIMFTHYQDDGTGSNTNEFDLYTVNPDGTGLLPVIVAAGYQASGSWSPDGTRLVYEYRPTSSGQQASIHTRNADGSNDAELISGSTPAWSPDGSMIAYVDNGIWIMQADGTNPHRLFHVDPGSINNATYPAWSPDGSRIAYLSGSGGIVVQEVTAPSGTLITPAGVIADRPSWSPDATRLTFGIVGGFQNSNDIAIVNADGTGYGTLIGDAGDENYPAWFGDGTEIVFSWNAGGQQRLYRMNANGTNVVPVTTGGHDVWPYWAQ
jgi:Tol biopolymer transport system component